eukprot:1160146-Pelagomonas_calceolata.AAC.6
MIVIKATVPSGLHLAMYTRAAHCYSASHRLRWLGCSMPMTMPLPVPVPVPLQVSFLLEVYGQLEEPDGLAGLMHLRHGGLTPMDQLYGIGAGYARAALMCSLVSSQNLLHAQSMVLPTGGQKGRDEGQPSTTVYPKWVWPSLNNRVLSFEIFLRTGAVACWAGAAPSL